MTFAEAPARARRLVQSGDTIVSTVRTYLRAVWPVQGETGDLIVSTGFAVLSPGPRLDCRYLGWVAQSDPVIEEIVARSVGVSYPAINGSEIGDIPVQGETVPEIKETVQRAYAGIEQAMAKRKIHFIAWCDGREETQKLDPRGKYYNPETIYGPTARYTASILQELEAWDSPRQFWERAY